MSERADSLREYLTGAASDGGIQIYPNFSLGNYRSATEAVCMGILFDTALTNTYVLYASGKNSEGAGVLLSPTPDTLTWQPNGATEPGLPATFSSPGDIRVVEALNDPGAYLRLLAPGKASRPHPR